NCSRSAEEPDLAKARRFETAALRTTWRTPERWEMTAPRPIGLRDAFAEPEVRIRLPPAVSQVRTSTHGSAPLECLRSIWCHMSGRSRPTDSLLEEAGLGETPRGRVEGRDRPRRRL